MSERKRAEEVALKLCPEKENETLHELKACFHCNDTVDALLQFSKEESERAVEEYREHAVNEYCEDAKFYGEKLKYQKDRADSFEASMNDAIDKWRKAQDELDALKGTLFYKAYNAAQKRIEELEEALRKADHGDYCRSRYNSPAKLREPRHNCDCYKRTLYV